MGDARSDFAKRGLAQTEDEERQPMDEDNIEINGVEPALVGRVCEAFICQSFRFEKEPESNAHITYMKFDGKWLRMYFEFRIVFWREEAPAPYEKPCEACDNARTDVGALAGVVGQMLATYEMTAAAQGSKVTFNFVNGRKVIIEDEDDIACYQIA
jgi:hypothetical protein